MFKSIALATLAAAALVAAPDGAAAGDYGFRIGYHRGNRGSHVSAEVLKRRAPVVVRHVRHRGVIRHRGHHHHRHVHSKSCRWVPGRFVTKVRSVWEPGYYTIETRPAVYRTRRDPLTCRDIEVEVRPERRVRVWVEGRYVDRKVRIWRRGHWKCVKHHC